MGNYWGIIEIIGELWVNYGGIVVELWGILDVISYVAGCCLFLLCGPLLVQTW